MSHKPQASGTSGGVSATAAMSIEQMFEDIPNSTFNAGGNPHEKRAAGGRKKASVDMGRPGKKPQHHQQQQEQQQQQQQQQPSSGAGNTATQQVAKGRSKVVKSGSEIKSKQYHGVFRTLDTTNPKSGADREPSATSRRTGGSATAGLSTSRSAEEARGKRAGRRSSSTHQLDRMTPTTALAMFGSKLTPHEQTEIKSYNNVYFMGLSAKKVGASQTKYEQTTYDDDENFYKVVPHDHIMYRFEVAEKPNLGKGTFGQVIKAYDHKERTVVALKLVRGERIYLKQSREELRILQVLRKQDPNGFYNIVQMKEFFMFRNHMIIVFELLGMNLYQVITKNGNRGLPLVRILPIARGILKCLELLFKNRIIHCDLKPENIMLRRNGDLSSIKVGDFGSSCYEQQQVYHYIQSRYYRAPEVILGMRYGPAIDMWSLGCVLGELCTGSPLFMGNSEADQLAAIEEMMGEVPKAMLAKSTKFKEGVTSTRRGGPGSKHLHAELSGDDAFKDLVAKMLTVDPNLRPTPMDLQEHPWLCKNRSLTNSITRPGGNKQKKTT